ncbi:uncharacterized protein LOC132166798 [Corylus avellana]|uniref:uncharacterized protein LOC132166798 n=1 Tax=Corylus avellana TaxID=13451 RepID=UPI00286CDBC6|nr:uncharacterized protein LOC132166798 [Corylus avellana]
MYASAKVRANKQDDQFSLPNDGESLLILRIKDSLSIRDNQSHSPPSLAKITKAHIPKLGAQSIYTSRETVKNNGQSHTNTKSNITANSVPPPRAVLSSPDNDGMIGSRKKLMEEKSWHSSTNGKMQGQNKVKAARPLSKKKGSKEVSDNKSSLKQRKLHEQKPHLREGKSSPNAI